MNGIWFLKNISKWKKKENEAEDNKVMERGRFVGGWQRRRVRFTGPVPKTPAADEQSLISSCFCLLWGQNRFFYNQGHYWIPSSLFLVMHLITCCSLNIETLGDVIFLFIEFKKKNSSYQSWWCDVTEAHNLLEICFAFFESWRSATSMTSLIIRLIGFSVFDRRLTRSDWLHGYRSDLFLK